MQQPDYYYQYSQNPNPNSNPTDHYPPTTTTTFQPPPYSSTASAPPYTTNYAAAAAPAPPPPPPQSDYSSYPPYPQTSNPAPTASSYAQPSAFPQFESHTPYQPQPPPQSQPQSYYHQTTSNYAPPVPNPSPNLNNPSSNYQYNQYTNSSPYESTAPKFDQAGGGIGGYPDDYSGPYGGYGRSASDSGHVYGGASRNDSGRFGGGDGASRYDSGGYGGSNGASRYDSGGGGDGASRYDSGGYGGDGVYAYQGSKVEPYGSRGNGSKSSMWKDNSQQVMFDDFGRPIGIGNGKEQSSGSPKIVKAVPKADSQQDSKGGGVQKFRVKLLGESGGQSTQDVLCQIGLDGIRMLDPSTSRTLRIYPLDTITRCEVIDSSTFTFWSKSSVDYDAKRIRLQSNSYTTNTLLDTVTAATIQLKEMGGRSRPADHAKVTEEPNEKKKGLGDWMNAIKPVNEEKDHWVPDEAVNKCTSCGTDFGAFVRRHHCRNCGDIFCVKCTQGRIALTAEENAPQVRVCDRCMAEVTTRLSNAKETASRSTGLQTHEDLAKKLQEELERNRKSSSGSKSNGSGKRMKEVACPTCTVHLQVQVPSSGSETIECGVCQHPFLVSAH